MAIHDYGAARFGVSVAAEYTRGFNATFALLQQYPLAGRLRPELREGTRCKPHRRHLIFYRVAGDGVLIQRILHHAQEIASHLRP